MTLADASVWIGHFRSVNDEFGALVEDQQIAVHPFVIGEISCGKLRQRERVLRYLELLPAAVVARHNEVLHLVDRQRLWGTGIGWVDAHLLASACLSNCTLWTLDKALQRAAARVGAAYRG
jgi:predicted nucleic acid-binding protein